MKTLIVLILSLTAAGCFHSGSMSATTSTGSYGSNSKVTPFTSSDSFEERKTSLMRQCLNEAGVEAAHDICEEKVLHRYRRMCRYMADPANPFLVVVRPCPGQPGQ